MRLDEPSDLELVPCSGCLFHQIQIINGVDLLVDKRNSAFRIKYSSNVAPETVNHCVYDLIAPMLLSASGEFVLHGGLVNTPQGAVAFYGPSGRGKSTLTASLDRRGFDLMGDDAIILETEWASVMARRLYASLRLKPDSLDHLFETPPETAPMAGYSVKRRVFVPDKAERAPLLALFFLDEPTDDILCARIPPTEAMISLTTHSFVFDAEDMDETRMKFRKAARVVQDVPVFRLTYPRDYARLLDVHAAIFDAVDTSQEAG